MRTLQLAAILALLGGCTSRPPQPANLKPYALQQSPPPASDQMLFVVVGDAGRGNDAQVHVGRLMAQVCQQRRPGKGCDFGLAPGDLIYETGVKSVEDPKFQSHFEEPFRALGDLPIWSVPGNHDWKGGVRSLQSEIDYTARSPRWRMPFHHFAVTGLPAWLHIYGLDTTLLEDGGEAGRAQIAAAQSELCGKPGWRLLLGHHPVYSSGQHGRKGATPGESAPMREALSETVIRKCGVQAYFAGHDHIQEYIEVRDPNYRQVIQGAGSEARTNNRPFSLPHAQSKFLAAKFGFALVTATPSSMKIEFFGFSSSKGPTPAEQAPIYAAELRHDVQ